MGLRHPDVEEVEPIDERFSKLLSYSLYRICDITKKMNEKTHDAASKQKKQVKLRPSGMEPFTDKPPIAVLQWLTQMTAAFNNCRIP